MHHQRDCTWTRGGRCAAVAAQSTRAHRHTYGELNNPRQTSDCSDAKRWLTEVLDPSPHVPEFTQLCARKADVIGLSSGEQFSWFTSIMSLFSSMTVWLTGTLQSLFLWCRSTVKVCLCSGDRHSCWDKAGGGGLLWGPPRHSVTPRWCYLLRPHQSGVQGVFPSGPSVNLSVTLTDQTAFTFPWLFPTQWTEKDTFLKRPLCQQPAVVSYQTERAEQAVSLCGGLLNHQLVLWLFF